MNMINTIIRSRANFLRIAICMVVFIYGIPLLAGAQANNWLLVARDYMSAGTPDKATVFFMQAASVEPANGQIRAELAYSLQQAGHYDDALNEYTLALGLSNPPILDVKYNMGIIHAVKKEYGNAKNVFSDVLTLDPTYAPAYLNRANTEVMTQEYATAKKDYETYLAGDIEESKREQVVKMLEILSKLKQFPARTVDKTQYKEKQKLEKELNRNRKRLADTDDATNTYLGSP